MASKETWDKLRYFRPTDTQDKWGDPDAINDSLLMALDDFRAFLGCSIHINRGVATSGHSKKSYHYRSQGSCAVDALVPGYAKGPINLIIDAMRFGFTGLGYYPAWKWNGKIVGGLHLDTRPLKWEADETLNYRHNRWVGVPHKAYIDGKMIEKTDYLPMSMENLIKYGRQYGHIKGDLVLDDGQLPGDID